MTVDSQQLTSPDAGPKASEAPLTLSTEPPRTFGVWAQTALWGNLGISLFGPLTGALIGLSVGTVAGGILATVVGCLIGALILGGSATFGAVTGAPSMVALRGLLGRRGSVVPTILNILQNIGWGTMEIIVISTTAASILGSDWRWPFVVLTGIVTTVMAIRPLGSAKLLRTVMVWLVLLCSVYLFVVVLRQPVHPIDQSGVIGFWPGVDLAVAGVVSFAPLAADYSRHSRSTSAAFIGAGVGYGLAAIAYYALGVLAVAHLTGDLSDAKLIGALVALPAGGIALFLLMVDEVDEAFANIYSTTMSVHNILPNLDRRIISVVIGVIATLLAGLMDFSRYQSFLFLIGSFFVPLFTVAVVDFALIRRGQWDVSDRAPFRWVPVVAWLAGFVAYQLIYPGDIPGWSSLWAGLAAGLGFVAPSWLGSSVGAILVSGIVMAGLGQLERRRA
ncbi:putative hydroxymethylpyrimidine transporter CytX [Raineyella antarctica]|uniref:Putative hydroxymethylpyrimidine transporter CytX n=1 Tax=Raineyella antarctica TaxID=1577474 RepID=A0A1G6H4J6_9ACTN|nr:cytosine permease [Raineyella antarctica]SDB89192.1 putative hydroxymethylpyrimidine transporter CytX [Raineyella antarctica]